MNIHIKEFLKIKNLEKLEESFNLAKYVSSRVDTEEARIILIHILEIWNQVNDQTKGIWISLIERAGFYPYLKKEDETSLGLQAKIRKQWYKSDYLDNVYFHSKQKIIEQKINLGENVAVSAPTSFGKSLIIEEIVSRNQFDNILIIQPTLALIDETRKKMKKYETYNIIVNTLQKKGLRNIFILTAERVLEYENLPFIDFFVVDEFYKVSTKINDERINVLNIAVHKILSNKPQSLFLTPSVDALSSKFIDKYNIHFLKTDYSLVNTNVHEIRLKTQKEKKLKLFEMLNDQTTPSLVYVSSPQKAFKLANEYGDYLIEHHAINNLNTDLSLIEWIDKNISEKWKLKTLLSLGIGVHNGQLPRHTVTSQLDYFENKILNVLFVTTSLIEGVNTSAKNMYIFETKKGNIPIDYFDYSNIKGRAGRMNKYYTGEIYIFGDIPSKEEFKIDVPFVEQIEISDEILVNLKTSEVNDNLLPRLHELQENVSKELMSIIRKNTVSVVGQKSLFKYIDENHESLQKFLIWEGMPTYPQLYKTLHLAYNFLDKKQNDNYAKKMSTLSLKFVNSPSLKRLISDQNEYYFSNDYEKALNKEIKLENELIIEIQEKAIEKAISEMLSFARKDAGYRIPKMLNIVQSIQEYIYSQRNLPFGDYSFFASRLENESVDERLRMLVDFGVPTSAIRIISKNIPSRLTEEEEIIQFIKNNLSLVSQDLIEYEKDILLGIL